MASSARFGALVAGSGVSKVGSAWCFFGRAQRQQWSHDGPQTTGQSPSPNVKFKEAGHTKMYFPQGKQGTLKCTSLRELPSPEWGAARHGCERMHWRK
ncbi:hypothetical protein BDA96_04G154400 [Sorghum bicolor]|uniref:Uncharacterized protein n=1 Tax=Sorghum bicolor TaxID=4558 RepID=A0A921R300_SORBI|nr:hypothetical protein BDA96_04G154400 [Sorghum bicolor]